MESLACCISFWEDALLVFTGNNSNNVSNRLMPSEDSQFCKELQLLVEAAYSLQNQCQLLFLDQVSKLIRYDNCIISCYHTTNIILSILPFIRCIIYNYIFIIYICIL